MAQVVFGVVGAAVGGYFGGPQGASLGWTIGTTIGCAFAPPNKVYRPRLTDLKLPTFDYGSPVPRVFGAHRVPGAVVWMSAMREIATTQDVGKGGPRTEVTSYTYHADSRAAPPDPPESRLRLDHIDDRGGSLDQIE